MSKALTYVEVDIEVCSLTYGTAPCTAAIPGTGDKKCFNSLNTCQDTANIDLETVTLRFGLDSGYLPSDIDCIPSVVSVSVNPATVSLGENLGTRGTVTVSFRDHRHSDTGEGFDKYLADRSYDPFNQGTFWGKFRARHPFLRGKDIRIIRGVLGQELAAMETRHYTIDSFNGPTPNGQYTLVAKDILKLASGDRAVAPAASPGSLNAAITDVATSATLSPSGIGNSDYPASGKVAIGGKEICTFTRAADVLTLTRAQLNTVAVAHNAESRVQVVLEYSGEDPADIIQDLLETYASVPSSYIPLSTWQAETATYLQRVYTAYIAEPTPVEKLISEIVEQAALAIWWDDLSQTIKLIVLREISLEADLYDESNTLADSLKVMEQQNKRISQVWTYYAQINPLISVDELDNYRSIRVNIDADNETNYGTPSIKKIVARWIPEFGDTIADRLNEIQLSRFSTPPRKVGFSLLNKNVMKPQLGAGYNLNSFSFQDDEGESVNIPIQITELRQDSAVVSVVAEEMLFEGITLDDPDDHTIIINANTFEVDILTLHDTLYPAIGDPYVTSEEVTVIVAEGVIVGSHSSDNPAMTIDGFPSGTPIELIVNGRIQGKGGDVAGSASPPDNEHHGGTALYVRDAIDLDNQGEIWGGGGAGAIGGTAGAPRVGGGGQGQDPGIGNVGTYPGTDGTTEAAGTGYVHSGTHFGGDGGAKGADGNDGGPSNITPPGDAGNAIDGISNVTVTTAGDREGPEIN